MKKIYQLLCCTLSTVLLLSSCIPKIHPDKEVVVVANRGDKSLSAINATNNQLIGTHPMPDNGEPMYVTYDATRDRVFVGDRANNRVVAFNAASMDVDGFVPAGAGVFHMWDAPDDATLWVVNDIDLTLSVIDQENLALLQTVHIPFDLAESGGKPHDVIVDPDGSAAYTTIVGVGPNKSVVVKYSTSTFMEIGRAEVGGDAHLSVTDANGLLYVPAQVAGKVYILNRSDLSEVKQLDVPGAHGAGMTPDGSFLYVTNLPAGGSMAIYTIDLSTNTVVGSPTTVSSDGVPHNLAVNDNSSRLYLTHSGGSATKFDVLRINGAAQTQPATFKSLNLGLNPFGLVYFKRSSQ